MCCSSGLLCPAPRLPKNNFMKKAQSRPEGRFYLALRTRTSLAFALCVRIRPRTRNILRTKEPASALDPVSRPHPFVCMVTCVRMHTKKQPARISPGKLFMICFFVSGLTVFTFPHAAPGVHMTMVSHTAALHRHTPSMALLAHRSVTGMALQPLYTFRSFLLPVTM